MKPVKPFPCAWLQDSNPHIIVDAWALRHPVLPLGRSGLRGLLAYIQDSLDLGGAKWELHITTDLPMARLHALHLGGAGPTNVLAFPARTVQGRTSDDLGSIALNADAVMREAYLYGQDPTEHFIRLLTHALLHLVGFDHGHAMEKLTESVVQGIGNQGGGQTAAGAAKEAL